jgi:hypothetical protein
MIRETNEIVVTRETNEIEDYNYIVVYAKLIHSDGNRLPNFAVVSEIWGEPRVKYRSKTKCRQRTVYQSKPDRDPDMRGCGHEYVLKAFPDMADIVSLHLSWMDGAPMYAFENGHYYLTDKDRKGVYGYGDDVAAKHFRIPIEDVPAMRGWDKETLLSWIESQKDRWKFEADTVIKKYGLEVVHK